MERGVVSLFGVRSALFVAMSSRGRLYATVSASGQRALRGCRRRSGVPWGGAALKPRRATFLPIPPARASVLKQEPSLRGLLGQRDTCVRAHGRHPS